MTSLKRWPSVSMMFAGAIVAASCSAHAQDFAGKQKGMSPRATQPAEWAKYMRAELDRYSKIIKDANIKPE